jgi:hypothetical protein
MSEWTKYFSSLLNNKNSNASESNRPTAAPADNPEIPTENISREEVEQAINELSRGKSSGPDYAMTAEVRTVATSLSIICQLVYNKRKAPSQWRSNLIVPIPKKAT